MDKFLIDFNVKKKEENYNCINFKLNKYKEMKNSYSYYFLFFFKFIVILKTCFVSSKY